MKTNKMLENMEIKPGYTRITEVLKQWDTYGMIAPSVLNAKAELGKTVHDRIELEDTPGAFFSEEQKVITQGYYDSYCRWRDSVKERMNAQLIESESRYYCEELKITGQIDAIYTFDNNQIHHIFDWKNAASAVKTWELQAGFYHYLVGKKYPLLSDTVQFVQLNKSGRFPMIHRYEITKDLMRTCFSALRCYRWLNDI